MAIFTTYHLYSSSACFYKQQNQVAANIIILKVSKELLKQQRFFVIVKVDH
jgi:hypothetical protein